MATSRLRKGTPSPQGNRSGKDIAQVDASNIESGSSFVGITNFDGRTWNMVASVCLSASTVPDAILWMRVILRNVLCSCTPSLPSNATSGASLLPMAFLLRFCTTSSTALLRCPCWGVQTSSTSFKTRTHLFCSSSASFKPTMQDTKWPVHRNGKKI